MGTMIGDVIRKYKRYKKIKLIKIKWKRELNMNESKLVKEERKT